MKNVGLKSFNEMISYHIVSANVFDTNVVFLHYFSNEHRIRIDITFLLHLNILLEKLTVAKFLPEIFKDLKMEFMIFRHLIRAFSPAFQ